MKFKSILIFFQVILAISFFLVFLLPLPVLGLDWTLGYWGRHWYWAVLFGGVLVGAWYLIQRQTRYLSFLENEDWKGLSEAVDDDFRRTGRIDANAARLWVHACFLSQNAGEVLKIEERLKEKHPALAERLALLFALPGWLRKDQAGTEARLEAAVQFRKLDDRLWVEWALGFLKLSAGKAGEGASLLNKLKGRKDHLGFLSSYLLTKAEPQNPVNTVLQRRWAKVPVVTLRKRAEKMKESQILAVFLDGMVDDAVKWAKGEKNAG